MEYISLLKLTCITLLHFSQGKEDEEGKPYYKPIKKDSSPLHMKCRNGRYPSCTTDRFPVPDDKVSWSVPWDEYDPPFHMGATSFNMSTADLDMHIKKFKPKWNAVDGLINRVSYMGKYNVVNKYPMNPAGRTGIAGRGLLGRWGPNHSVHTILTRWKTVGRGKTVVVNRVTMQPILQVLAIKNRNRAYWAIPGKMICEGETYFDTVRRVFFYGISNIFGRFANATKVLEKKDKIIYFLQNYGRVIYKGYGDDPRNTDNAWVELLAIQYHDETGKYISNIPLRVRTRTMVAAWVDMDDDTHFIARHSFMKNVSSFETARKFPYQNV